MEKIKTFFKWLFANKKSLGSTVVGALATGTGIVSSWTIDALPQIMVSGFNIAPIIYTVICLVCFILNELGICGKGFETIKTYLERVTTEKAKAEAKAIEKAAQKELKAEKAKAEAEAKAVEAEAQKQLEADKKAQKEAEFTAKVQAKKDEIKAQDNNL